MRSFKPMIFDIFFDIGIYVLHSKTHILDLYNSDADPINPSLRSIMSCTYSFEIQRSLISNNFLFYHFQTKYA